MALNQEASTLSTLFSHRLLAATTGGALTVTDREAALAHEQGDSWRLMLQNTTQQPQLQHLARHAPSAVSRRDNARRAG